MSRAERLLQLMQALRRHREPVSGAALAAELRISVRTLYRDIASLQAQGARIDAQAGVGYVLRPGFLLPPLMFTDEEIEALALGSRWVASRADRRLGEAARNLMAKIAAVLPAELRHELDTAALMVGPAGPAPAGDRELAQIRAAIRAEQKLDIVYRDLQGRDSRRTVWPFAIGFFDKVRVLAAWCELRGGFRHFRTDRIVGLDATPQRYPRRRQALLKEWRHNEGVARQ
ncbi:helix-turn-helix transcriptional regulator [Janthinobacterium fluminis]|uniref:YafY family protein n=1 Tax=Janthinobacterium fluminis TaxID=2987524 RepID=A0ABT5K9E9_9BURK|nr:YafY family protein [Janthinobacterium fluminis]MDC8760422.1 YafY family protein [Janthinobacterium fluminis]